MIAALQYEDPATYNAFMEDQRQATGENHIVHDSGRFPLCGRGDVNTYTIFAETMRLVISPTGRVGCIVPSGIATDDTTKFFFRDLMDSQTLVNLYDFENAEAIFIGVHRSYKFCLLTLAGHAKPAKEGAQFAFFLHNVGDLQENERRFILSARDLALINPNTRTCPIFRTKHDLDITKNVYTRVPVLLKEGTTELNPWSVTFPTVFHMANDSHLFRFYEQLVADSWTLEGNIFYKEEETCLPLYEGKMIWHFDHRFGSYSIEAQSQMKQGKIPEVVDLEHRDPLMLSMPRYWVHVSNLPNILSKERKAFLAFRDITNSTNLRTAVFCVLPVVPCGDTLHAIVLDSKYISDTLNLASCVSSFIFDYVASGSLAICDGIVDPPVIAHRPNTSRQHILGGGS